MNFSAKETECNKGGLIKNRAKMTTNHRWLNVRRLYRPRMAGAAAVFVTFRGDPGFRPNCNTALGRFARAAAERAVIENRQTACKGFRHGSFAIDKTRALELRAFSLCENGAVVTVRIDVRIECATSDAAFIRTSVDDTLSAHVSANLETCKVFGEQVSGNGFLTNVGLDWANVAQDLKEAAEREIKPYCTG
jgi:hypothetical protein